MADEIRTPGQTPEQIFEDWNQDVKDGYVPAPTQENDKDIVEIPYTSLRSIFYRGGRK